MKRYLFKPSRASLTGVVVLLLGALGTMARAEVFRIGMIGLDTSHVIAFTKQINDPKNDYGCKVVAGFPGGSPDAPVESRSLPVA